MENSTPSPSTTRFPTFRRLLRAIFSWRTMRRCLVTLAALVTLVAIFYTEENVRGKRAWRHYEAGLPARGIELDWMKFVPPAVPDDQNFAMTPFLKPLFDFNSRPLQPGQEIHRDTNGFKRATDFGAGLDRTTASNAMVLSESHPINLAAAVAMLREPTNAHPADIQFASRADAAKELLKEFEIYKPVLEELHAASRRPHARFNIQYDSDDRVALLLPHLTVIRKTARVFQIRAAAELAVGDDRAALDDLGLSIYLVDSMEHEPLIISHLVREVLARDACKVIWDGIAEHRWSDAELHALQNRLRKMDLLAEMKFAIDGERAAFGTQIFEVLRTKPQYLREWFGGGPGEEALFRLIPSGWLYLEQLSYHRLYDELMVPGLDVKNRRVDPGLMDRNTKRVMDSFGAGTLSKTFGHRIFASMLLPALSKCMEKAAFAQTTVDETIVACALERHRLMHGSHPDSLETLRPAFIEEFPRDIINGSPLQYRRLPTGGYVLYSVGWNAQDNGGAQGWGKGPNPSIDIASGDWIWPPYPEK